MKQKSFKLTVSIKKRGFSIEDPEKVVAFSQRLNKGMKVVRRDFQKKARVSAERASEMILNA